jgi:hypothetical protein
MDAMVFFAVSALICATLISYAASQRGDGQVDGPDPPDTDGLLAVFLVASLGKEFVIDDLGLEVTGIETFGEMLFLVSALMAQGCPVEPFSLVLAHCWQVLSDLCSPWSAVIRLSALEAGLWAPIVEVGGPPQEGTDTYSASQNLGASEGAGFMVTVLLFPALVLHGLCV